MNLEIQARKVLDFVMGQPPVVRIMLLFALVVFVIIPFGLPAAIIYFAYNAFKARQHAQ